MNGLPDLLFIVDIMRESTAVHEANLKGIPIVAMVDTNCNPSDIDYVIPANDDAIRAIKLMVAKVADAVLEGKAMRKEEDFDKEELEPIAEDDTRERSRARIQLEEDVDDEDLLGESTLQKLADSKREKSKEDEEDDEDDSIDDEDDEE
jgi:small subunit ribosomal protein S2